MNAAIRLVYLLLGFAGLVFAANYMITSFPTVNPAGMLLITVSVLILFFVTRRSYSSETEAKKGHDYDYKQAYSKD